MHTSTLTTTTEKLIPGLIFSSPKESLPIAILDLNILRFTWNFIEKEAKHDSQMDPWCDAPLTPAELLTTVKRVDPRKRNKPKPKKQSRWSFSVIVLLLFIIWLIFYMFRDGSMPNMWMLCSCVYYPRACQPMPV